jgi:hypothetical protein
MKNYTFRTETSENGFFNPFTGCPTSKRVIVVNNKGQKGCLPGELKPYSPIGGKKACLA